MQRQSRMGLPLLFYTYTCQITFYLGTHIVIKYFIY